VTARRLRMLFYGVASGLGLVLTLYFNTSYHGSVSYLRAWFANSASTSAAVDLITVSAAASVFMLVEGRRLRIRLYPAYPVLGVVLAMAFSVPLFLLMRERALARPHDRDSAAGR